MGFRTNVRGPTAYSAFSTTATSLATLTISGQAGRQIAIAGFGLVWDTAFSTTVEPNITDSAGTILRIGRTTSNTFNFLTFPVLAATGSNVVMTTTVSAAAQTVNLSLHYYFV